MARLDRPTNENSNPAIKFLEWKSNDKCFQYYDKNLFNDLIKQGKTEEEVKEKKLANVKVELPLKVLFLEHYHNVKGWNDNAKSGIWSNEVYSIAKEPLEVKSKAGTIVKGIYKEVRSKIVDAGGVYHRSVYCMDTEGNIINLQLKGAVIGGLKKENSVDKTDVKGYSDFYKDNHHLLDNQWIVINGVKEGKKGAVKFSIPFFELGEVITRETDTKANYAASVLQDYMNHYFGVEAKEEVTETNDELETVKDDLDF